MRNIEAQLNLEKDNEYDEDAEEKERMLKFRIKCKI